GAEARRARARDQGWRGRRPSRRRRVSRASKLAAVIGPMQQRLALTLAAGEIAGRAIGFDLRHMPADRLPAIDLAAVLLGHAPPPVIAAIPLEPAARIVGMDPAFLPPDRQRLAGVDAE